MSTYSTDALFDRVQRYPLDLELDAELVEISFGRRHVFVMETNRDEIANGKSFAELVNLASNLRLCSTVVPIEISTSPPMEVMYLFVSRIDELWRISAYMALFRATLSGFHKSSETMAHLQGIPDEIIDRARRYSVRIDPSRQVFIVGEKSEIRLLLDTRHRPLKALEGQLAFAPEPYVLKPFPVFEELGIGIARCHLDEGTINALFSDRSNAVVRTLTSDDIDRINRASTANIEVLTDRGWV